MMAKRPKRLLKAFLYQLNASYAAAMKNTLMECLRYTNRTQCLRGVSEVPKCLRGLRVVTLFLVKPLGLVELQCCCVSPLFYLKHLYPALQL